MKKLSIILVLILVSKNSWSDVWTKVDENNGTTTYIDFASIQ